MKRSHINSIGISDLNDTWVVAVCRNGLLWCGIFVFEAYFRGYIGEIYIENFGHCIFGNDCVFTFAQNSMVAIADFYFFLNGDMVHQNVSSCLEQMFSKYFAIDFFSSVTPRYTADTDSFPRILCQRSGIYFDYRGLCVT